jgi:hypothetical protein
MRPDDPHQGEEREPIALGGHEQPDPEVAALLEQASDLVVEAVERRVEPGYTPVPEGGVITDQFMVHDNDTDPRRGRGSGGGADPHALMYIGTEQDWSQRVTAFLTEKDAMEWGSAFPGRRLWRVRSITLDQPMVVVLTPAQFHLLTEDEARTHNEMEDDDE